MGKMLAPEQEVAIRQMGHPATCAFRRFPGSDCDCGADRFLPAMKLLLDELDATRRRSLRWEELHNEECEWSDRLRGLLARTWVFLEDLEPCDDQNLMKAIGDALMEKE